MKVGLIGAPETGKTQVAKALAKEFNLDVIDDYVPDLEVEMDLALGYSADFLPNIQVPARRWALERRKDDNFVTCGTHVESACYMSIWTSDVMRMFPENAYTAIDRARICGDVIALYIATAWVYDQVFYLPLPAKAGVELDKRLDLSIRDALAMLSIDHITLDEEDRAAQAVRILKEKHAVTDSSE